MVVSDPNEEETGKEAWFMPTGRWVGPVCTAFEACYSVVSTTSQMKPVGYELKTSVQMISKSDHIK